jgi:hypothetical protein
VSQACDNIGLTAFEKFFDAATQIGRLRRACYDKLLQHEQDGALPTNGRFIFYELEQDGVVPKAYFKSDGTKRARTPAQNVSDALLDLREVGLIPWDWIIDEMREVSVWRSAKTVLDYVIEATEYARIDCWKGQPAPLTICESRATAGVLNRIAMDYLAPITGTGGQCGGFLVTDVVPLLRGNDRQVLYMGDHEVDGPADQIENNTRRYLEKHAGRSVNWTRIALTQAQVDVNARLLDLVIEKTDMRTRPPRPYKAVECEAVGQVTLEQVLRETLDRLLPEPLEAVLVREAAERETLVRQLRRWRGSR